MRSRLSGSPTTERAVRESVGPRLCFRGGSGGAWYRKGVTLSAELAARHLTLDLGDVVASAEVRVNGRAAGIRPAPPWRFDITPFVQPGENRIEVLVYNTLANHYSTIPTRYRGSAVSGLLGPVRIETSP